MKIGILETGHITGDLARDHGTYPPMYRALLRRADPALEFLTVSLVDGELAGNPEEADGWLVSGSRHGVYDDLPWIEPTMQFLRDCLDSHAPVVGICFGHQLLAQAMGGHAGKSAKGWGVGVQDYRIAGKPGWMRGAPGSYAGYGFYQDQVVEKPAGSSVVAGNDFCEFAALAYGDPQAPEAISVQSHPEFSRAFIHDLIELRSGVAISKEQSALALQTLDQPVDNDLWAHWIVEFLHTASARKSAA